MPKPTFQDYKAAGIFTPRPVKPGWLVRTAAGYQFSTPQTREAADKQAAAIGGTVEWYTPTPATTIQAGQTYDH